jgi:hypothetical protein
MERFAWNDDDLSPIIKEQNAAFRKLLKVSSRAPIDAVTTLLDVQNCTTAFRANRAAHFLRLFNAPPDSYQYAALLVHHQLQTSWFEEALSDVAIAIPDIKVRISTTWGHRRFVSSSASWGHEVLNALRPYIRTPMSQRTNAVEIKTIKHLTKRISSQISSNLKEKCKATARQQILDRASQNVHSKTVFLSAFLAPSQRHPQSVLPLIGPIAHQMALSSLFVGDWFLGEHAANYFAKQFLPTRRDHITACEEKGIPPKRVCLPCWQWLGRITIEDAAHVLFRCPRYDKERSDFYKVMAGTSTAEFTAEKQSEQKVSSVFSSTDPQLWSEIGRLSARIRQSRRRMRAEFQHRVAKLKTNARVHDVKGGVEIDWENRMQT